MDITKALKMAMVNRDMKQIDVANSFYSTETNNNPKNTFNNLLRRNDYKLKDIIKIAEILNYDVKLQLVDKNTGKIIDIE